MNDDHITEPGILTRIGWFFWRNWNRLVCITRGHDLAANCICERCGLPIATWTEIDARDREIERLRFVLAEIGGDPEGMAGRVARTALNRSEATNV